MYVSACVRGCVGWVGGAGWGNSGRVRSHCSTAVQAEPAACRLSHSLQRRRCGRDPHAWLAPQAVAPAPPLPVAPACLPHKIAAARSDGGPGLACIQPAGVGAVGAEDQQQGLRAGRRGRPQGGRVGGRGVVRKPDHQRPCSRQRAGWRGGELRQVCDARPCRGAPVAASPQACPPPQHLPGQSWRGRRPILRAACQACMARPGGVCMHVKGRGCNKRPAVQPARPGCPSQPEYSPQCWAPTARAACAHGCPTARLTTAPAPALRPPPRDTGPLQR